MHTKGFFDKSSKDVLIALTPVIVVLIAAVYVAYKYVDPAPPKHFVIATGDGEGDYQAYAKLYKDIVKEDGVELEIRQSRGTWENLKFLEDPKSGVDVGFIHDGLGNPDKAPDLSSLGSLYYEPIWVFYRGQKEITKFSEFEGKKLAVGQKGSGTHTLVLRLLKESGVTEKNSNFNEVVEAGAIDALKNGQVDAAFFISTPDDPAILNLIEDSRLRLMDADQAEAIAKKIPYLHHLVLPHGALDLKKNLPQKDIDMVSPTATLLVKDSLHPALVYLLLKAVSQVHGEPGIFERKNEFPMDKDYQFPLSAEAKTFYKSGTPFWQRYLPFWLASLLERFIILVIPMLAIIIPVFKAVPRLMEWRLKSRFYRRYGELKYLETQIKSETDFSKYNDYIVKLDAIEERVNHMKVPLDFSDQIYGLKQNIHFVRGKLDHYLRQP